MSCPVIGEWDLYKARDVGGRSLRKKKAAEPKRSRRLRGLEPEERGLQCFICQMDIEIDTLRRSQRTSCCSAFMHKLCYREVVTWVRTCGNCRRANAEFEGEVVLEMDEEMEEDEEDNPFDIGTIPVSNAAVVRDLEEYRNDARHLYTHYEGSVHWNVLPFHIVPRVWYDYYSMWNDLLIYFCTRICMCTDVCMSSVR